MINQKKMTGVTFYWCEKCGFAFEWPHVKEHGKITHRLEVTIRMDKRR